jgi:hypothetical protein
MKYSHVEQSCFSRMMTLENTTSAGWPNQDFVYPSCAGNKCALYFGLYAWNNHYYTIGFYHLCKNVDISRGSSSKQKWENGCTVVITRTVHTSNHLWQRYSEWLSKSWWRRQPFSKWFIYVIVIWWNHVIQWIIR